VRAGSYQGLTSSKLQAPQILILLKIEANEERPGNNFSIPISISKTDGDTS
jgi:hypothetical protein